jgi:hypothetical protein
MLKSRLEVHMAMTTPARPQLLAIYNNGNLRFEDLRQHLRLPHAACPSERHAGL